MLLFLAVYEIPIPVCLEACSSTPYLEWGVWFFFCHESNHSLNMSFNICVILICQIQGTDLCILSAGSCMVLNIRHSIRRRA